MSSESRFTELNLCKKTLEGLEKENYVQMTQIQKAAIPSALNGMDVLGTAKTGSGKTLAFLIPVLEHLNKEKWTKADALGALVITPTRELALQIFEVLRKIGFRHSFSAGLVIGGKDFQEEQARIHNMNILICTPGRLLQHLDQSPGFDVLNLQILVIDEADKILEMGFSQTLNAIIENLPQQRQTLLFSATQGSSVDELVTRLGVKDLQNINVSDSEKTSTPQLLDQFYTVACESFKLDWLYSFIRTHLKCKILVFVSSCKQVRFIYESFCKLQPGIPLLALHGKQNQVKRFVVFSEFCKKQQALLVATDIASRGLDFPKIDWVIQLDCPDNVDTYIHRVGRTARYDSKGTAVLYLSPSEEPAMTQALAQRNIPISLIQSNPSKITSIQTKLSAICSQYNTLKQLAQKALVSYLRSIFLQPNKDVFSLEKINVQKLAEAWGLLEAPKLGFIKKNTSKNINRDLWLAIQSDENIKQQASKKRSITQPDTDDEDILISKSSKASVEPLTQETIESLAKPIKKKSLLKKLKSSQNRMTFDEEGNLQDPYQFQSENSLLNSDLATLKKLHLETSKKILQVQDAFDKEQEKLKRKNKKLKKKLKEKNKSISNNESVVELLTINEQPDEQSDDQTDPGQQSIESDNIDAMEQMALKLISK